MSDVVSNNKVVLTRRFAKKFVNQFNGVVGMMREDDLIQVSIMNNTLLIETDDTNILMKLEEQD